MQKITTLVGTLLLATVFFSSCKKDEIEGPKPGTDCATGKEWTDNQGQRFLLNEYEYKADKLTKITNYNFDGRKTESAIEYDAQGNLLQIKEKVKDPKTSETEYLTTFGYYEDGKLYKTDNFKVADGTNNLIQTRILYYEGDKVTKLVSSGGIHWRYEYNENGNVTRTYFKPQFTDEYLVEEYTGYDDKLLDKTAENARMLQNITLSSSGINLSKNNVLAYKTYNPDGSVNTSYTITREYNAAGNQIKIITTAVAGGVTTTTAVDTEYPTCK